MPFEKGNKFWLGKKRPNISGKNHPHYGKKMSEIHKSNCQCDWCKAERGEQEGEKQSEEMKQKRGLYRKGKEHPNYGRKRPDLVKRNKENNPMKNLESRGRMIEGVIKVWQTPEYIAKQMKARNVTPNKAEIGLNRLLQQLLPSEYRYVGNGEFILAGKCPDFININGQKKIIELFGNYWHKEEEEKDRINLFRQYGYETLIIWEKELENKELLRDRILQFNNI